MAAARSSGAIASAGLLAPICVKDSVVSVSASECEWLSPRIATARETAAMASSCRPSRESAEPRLLRSLT